MQQCVSEECSILRAFSRLSLRIGRKPYNKLLRKINIEILLAHDNNRPRCTKFCLLIFSVIMFTHSAKGILLSLIVTDVYNTIQYNNKNVHRAQWSTVVESEARAVTGWAKGGYALRVVREVRCRRLNVSNVLDSLMAAGNSFQMVGAEKLKERLLKLVDNAQKFTASRGPDHAHFSWVMSGLSLDVESCCCRSKRSDRVNRNKRSDRSYWWTGCSRSHR